MESLSIISSKLAHLAAHPDRYDTLFVGSSHVQVQIDPAVFDATTAAHGQPTHSFNLGVLGLYAPENAYLCEQLQALQLRGVRRVFVEIMGVDRKSARADPYWNRSIAWHNAARTYLVCRQEWSQADAEQSHLEKKLKRSRKRIRWWQAFWRFLWHAGATAFRAWPHVAPHLQCFLSNVTNLGDGATRLRDVLFLSATSAAEEIGPDEGYFGRTPMTDPATVAAYQKALADRPSRAGREAPLDSVSQENLESVLHSIRLMGAKPILFQPPNPWSLRPVPSRPVEAPLLNFSDLDRWPELFKLESRHDVGHLSMRGAEFFTRALAEEWLKLPLTVKQPP